MTFQIFLLFVIMGAIMLNESQAIEKLIQASSPSPSNKKHYTNFPAVSEFLSETECKNDLPTYAKPKFVEAICQDINVPLNQTLDYPSCDAILVYNGLECYFNVTIKNFQEQNSCGKGPDAIFARGKQIWDYCLLNNDL